MLPRFTFVTDHLPTIRGLSVPQKFYRKLIPDSARFRINDFDGDLKLDVDVRETIGVNLWHAPRLYEKRERELFCSAIRPGSVVLDVGANIGIYTLLAAKRGARIFAIEADPKNAGSLYHHITINGFGGRVTVFEMAATDKPCTLTLYRNPDNIGMSNIFSGTNPVTVSGRTIDSLNLPLIDVCKMDIEGAEPAALRGMQDTISRSAHMRLLIEELPQSLGIREFLQSRFRSISVLPTHPPTLWASH